MSKTQYSWMLGTAAVQVDVPDEIFVVVLAAEDFDDEERADLPPMQRALEVEREVAVRGNVGLRRRYPPRSRHKDTRFVGDVIDHIGTPHAVVAQQKEPVLLNPVVWRTRLRRHVESPVDQFVAIAFFVVASQELLERHRAAVVAGPQSQHRRHTRSPFGNACGEASSRLPHSGHSFIPMGRAQEEPLSSAEAVFRLS
jgi:hypothetical protein